MPALSLFLNASPHKLPSESLLEFLPAILSASKSSKPETRHAALVFFEIVYRYIPSVHLPNIAEEISLPLKTGKISSPEHRATLLHLLASLSPGDCSQKLIPICCDVLMKETNEDALLGLGLAIERHMSFLLSTKVSLGNSSLQAVVKAMQDTKPQIRRTMCNAIGLVLWRPNLGSTEADNDFGLSSSVITPLASSFVKAFEVNLKNASTNPLTSAA